METIIRTDAATMERQVAAVAQVRGFMPSRCDKPRDHKQSWDNPRVFLEKTAKQAYGVG